MDTEYEAFARELHRQRAELLKEFGGTEDDLHAMGEERESEWTDSAVEERQRHLLTNLDGRERETLDEINAALQRLQDGTYGMCEHCQAPIAFARLQAVPATRFCEVCAQQHDPTVSRVEAAEDDIPQSGPIPPDFLLLNDEEIEAAIWEQINDDGRIETEELSLACRRGVVFLSGALPSRTQHSILLQLITDVLGFQEVVDHIEVEQLAWQREDRDKAPATPEDDVDRLDGRTESAVELYGNEDIIESEGEILTEPDPLGHPAPEEE